MASGPVIVASAIVASSVLLLVGFHVMSSPATMQPQPVPVTPTVGDVAPVPAPVKVAQLLEPLLDRTSDAVLDVLTGPLAAWLGTRRPRVLQLAEFVERCWNPSAARQPEPRQIPLRFVLGFDAAGRLAASGIVEDRESYRSDVALCLRGIDLVFTIPAPGLPLQVEVPFTLP